MPAIEKSPPPTVSVIIPAYNAAGTIAEALESVFAQAYDCAVEIIVTDDGSTDATAAVLASFGARIGVIRQANQGLPTARNVAIERARGEYIALLDADDVWMPTRLAKTVAALRENPEAVLSFSDYSRMDRGGAVVQWSAVAGRFAHAPSMEELLNDWWPIAPTTVTMRRSTWSGCGGFHRATAIGFEDVYFFILARELGEFTYVAEPLARFRVTDSSRAVNKWKPDMFIKLIRGRYGARARGLIKQVRNEYAAGFAAKALGAMESGQRAEALGYWLKALHYDPLYPVRANHIWRAARGRNLRRLVRVLRPRSGGR